MKNKVLASLILACTVMFLASCQDNGKKDTNSTNSYNKSNNQYNNGKGYRKDGSYQNDGYKKSSSKDNGSMNQKDDSNGNYGKCSKPERCPISPTETPKPTPKPAPKSTCPNDCGCNSCMNEVHEKEILSVKDLSKRDMPLEDLKAAIESQKSLDFSELDESSVE